MGERIKNIIYKFSKHIRLMVLLIAIGMIIYPFLPQVNYSINRLINSKAFETSYYEEKYSMSVTGTKVPDSVMQIKLNFQDNHNRLIIPSIGVDIEIFFDEEQQTALNKGGWVVPGSAMPGEHGEMVISAHRFQILPPAKNSFYLLDKVEKGDVFYLQVNGYAYKYLVQGNEVIGAREYDFKGTSASIDEVVLYTCTPLWTASNRLLVYGKQIPFN